MPWRLPPILEISSVILPSELGETLDWGQQLVGLPDAWRHTAGGGVKIAVLDTGCDVDHPDLDGAVQAAKDFTNSRFGVADAHGHGTHCASVIGARANNVGIRGGASECRLLIGKVLGDNGAGTDQGLTAGVRWATREGANVISMSLGSNSPSAAIEGAIADAVTAGAFVICAAGNDGRSNSVDYPGRWTNTIAVAAVDQTGRVAKYSSRGREVDIAAPGSEILGAAPGGGYVRMSGTSIATPLVAAVVALCIARHAELGDADSSPLQTPDDLRGELARTAKDAGRPGKDSEYGYGLIQPVAMLPAEEEPADDESPPPKGFSWRRLLDAIHIPARGGETIGIDLGSGREKG